ncbi:hypothetical protein JCM17380_26810 [Desulfosporosinus burensis]
MFMGSLLILSSCFLYWMLRPPIPQNFILQEKKFEFLRNPSLNSEGVAGCLISQPFIR